MQSILSKAGLINSQLVMVDDENRIGAEIELIAKELQAYYTARGLESSDLDAMMERVRTKFGGRFEDELFGAWNSLVSTHAEAGFALGYYTAKHPEWLIFKAHTSNNND